MKYCNICCSADVEPSLSAENDLSDSPVGVCEETYGMIFRAGNRQPPALIVQKWDGKQKRNTTIGVYEPKYCPECGRPLKKAVTYRDEINAMSNEELSEQIVEWIQGIEPGSGMRYDDDVDRWFDWLEMEITP